MRNRRAILISFVSLACLLVAPAAFSTPAAAKDVAINLWGSTAGGWGLSNSTIGSPGPRLTVTQGDNVTIVLNGTDGRNHNFYIDYNNDSAVSAGEPSSPTFRNTVVTWNFTASQNGTFTYRSRFASDQATMWGNITVLLVAGIVVAFVAVLAVAAFVWRRKKQPGTPPPPTEPEQ